MPHDSRQTTAAEFDLLVADLRSSTGVLEALRSMGDLADLANRVPPGQALDALRPLIADHDEDPLAAYLALYAVSGMASTGADIVLVEALASKEPGLAGHAAWGLSRRRPVASAVPLLMDLAEEGGFPRMMAELALETWLKEMPDIIWQAGRQVPERFWHLSRRMPRVAGKRVAAGGMRIAQILMQGRVDAGLTAPGTGDGGGLITLQVGLTRELSRHEAVSEAFLITRSVADGSGLYDDAKQEVTQGGVISRISFGGSGYIPTADMWPHRAELERKLRVLLATEGPFDALHLRFADVGTFVGVRIAEELGIPIFFTLAPDPHAVIASAERTGNVTRETFATADAERHYVFRMWLVEWMLQRAEKLVLLPRADQRRQFEDLLGIDIEQEPGRFSVIPEGVDTGLAGEARRIVVESKNPEPPAVIGDLRDLVEDLPHGRRGLPLILSVGRLNRIKGMDRVVAAWAGDDAIRDRFNLLIVGGDLESPSREERNTLDSIAQAAGRHTPGLLMMGGRSNRDVAILMSAVAEGVAGTAGPGGLYVSGSEKEEFGLAIVEALAAGLPVVAPSAGGPSTYVEHGFTGYVTDTTEVARIRDGIHWADEVRLSEVRADSARRMVRSRYSLASMADQLVDLYREAPLRRSSAS